MKNLDRRMLLKALGVAVIAVGLARGGAEAQERGNRGKPGPSVEVSVSLGADVTSSIREFYADRPASGAKPIPPGIRRNLARGKPLPPGIAKTRAPASLVSVLSIPSGFEIVEVGLDVLLVETATAVIHDVLMDVIR